MPTLQLTLHASTGRQYAPFVRKHVLGAHAILRPPLLELSLAMVGDARMSALHHQFMNIAGTTDVLTFPLDENENGRTIAGEVVVCVPEAARQAAVRGQRIEHELLLYAIHGMLHLCGFDDRTELAFRRMHRKEDQILTRLGVGAVFKAHDPGEASASLTAQSLAESANSAKRLPGSRPAAARPRPTRVKPKVGAR